MRASSPFKHLASRHVFCLVGTPPRVLKRSIDFSGLEEHRGDASPQPFSFLNDAVWIKVGGTAVAARTLLAEPCIES